MPASPIHAAYYSLTDSQIDDLKLSVDLRDEIEQDLGPGQRAGKWRKYHSPFRIDKKPSFGVCASYYKDFAIGQGGDIFTWLMTYRGLTFREAIAYLEERGGGYADLSVQRRSTTKSSAAATLPPTLDWQRAAVTEVDEAERYLWSENGAGALAYLRAVRGLSDETIRHFRLGYNPMWKATGWLNPETGKPAYLAPGITLPWFVGEQIWALKVRCRVGNLAQALHMEPEHFSRRKERELPKYINLAGGSQAGALFNANSIIDGRDVLFVEGEFDAILAWQYAGEQIASVTLGSASYVLPADWRKRLEVAPHILSAMDNDAAGRQATQLLLAVFESKYRCLTVPAGKDLTEFVVEYSGNVMEWLCSAAKPVSQIAPTGYWSNGLPNVIRRAGLSFLTPALTLVAELYNKGVQEGVLSSDNPFTLQQLAVCNERVGWSVKTTTITEALATDSEAGGVFFEKLDPKGLLIASVEEDSGSKKPKKGGRPAAVYRARPIEDVVESLIERAYFRLIEKHHRVDGKEPVLAEVSPAWFLALGYGDEEAEQLSALVDEQFVDLPRDENADERAKREYAAIRRELKQATDPDAGSTPLPIRWVYDTPTQYRTAVLRAEVDARPGQRRSRRELARLIGVSEASITVYLERAGLENVEQFEEKRLALGMSLALQIKQAERQCKGRAIRVISVRNGTRREIFFGWECLSDVERWVKVEQVAGGEVVVRLQVASLQQAVEVCAVDVVSEVSCEEPTPPGLEKVQDADCSEQEPKLRHYGASFNPQWVIEQLILLEALARGYSCRNGKIFNGQTGEIYGSVAFIGAGGGVDIGLLDWLGLVARGKELAHSLIGDGLV